MQQNSKIPLQVGVLGLGQMGMRYDLKLPTDQVLSHCRAVDQNSGSELLFGVDLNPQARVELQEHYGKPAFASIADAIESCGEPDIWICALHPEHRHEFLQYCAVHPPKAVLLEKPLGLENDEIAFWQRLQKEHGSLIVVNYPRLFEPKHLEIAEQLQQAQTLYAKCYYPKDWHSNGIHFILQSLVFWGKPQKVLAHPRFKQIENRFLGELSLDYGNFRVDFIGVDHIDFNIAEFEILTNLGRHHLLDSGRIYAFDQAEFNTTWQMNFIAAGPRLETDLKNYQRRTWNEFLLLAQSSTPKQSLASSQYLQWTQQAQDICAEVLEKWTNS